MGRMKSKIVRSWSDKTCFSMSYLAIGNTHASPISKAACSATLLRCLSASVHKPDSRSPYLSRIHAALLRATSCPNSAVLEYKENARPVHAPFQL
ncbi:hypothetical protein ACFX1Z_010914 [Malus domestica]